MTKELQTIREAIEEIKRTPHHPGYDTNTYDYACEALAALDTLAAEPMIDIDASLKSYYTERGFIPPQAAEPSEDAIELAVRIRQLHLGYKRVIAEDYQSAAIIEAALQKVREECADRAEEIMYGDMYNWELKKMRAAIIGKE